jgi:OOP family OmpA-OmpF porin
MAPSDLRAEPRHDSQSSAVQYCIAGVDPAPPQVAARSFRPQRLAHRHLRSPTMNRRLPAAALVLAAVVFGTGLPARAAPETPAAIKAARAEEVAAANRLVARSAVLSAQGLFVGEALSKAAKLHLDALIDDAADLDLEVALLVPSGPWNVGGKVVDDRALTPARLAALRAHLVERGVNPKHIYIESRIDHSATEPRLVLELVGKPAPQ